MKRNATIDCIRVLAIISVIFVHVEGAGMPYGLAAKFISHMRFAVSFFMIVAGLQWGRKIRAGATIRDVYARHSSRTLKMFAFWSLVYLAIPLNIRDIPNYLQTFSQHGALSLLKIPWWRFATLIKGQGNTLPGALYVLLTGTKYHLWFLTALVCAATMTALLLKWRRETWLMWVAAGLYLFGVSSLLISQAFPGLSSPCNTRCAPFFGTIFFFVVGWRLSSPGRSFRLKPALALLAAGVAAEAVDLLVSGPHFGVTALRSFVETTLGIGCVLLALARPSLGAGTILPSLGRYTLGIYVLHPIFIDFLKPFSYLIPGAVRDLSFPLAVCLSTALATMLLQKMRLLRPLLAASRPAETKARGYDRKTAQEPGASNRPDTSPDPLYPTYTT